MAKETCKCCGIDIYDAYYYQCPVCGNIVCELCFDGEMCDDCRRAEMEHSSRCADVEADEKEPMTDLEKAKRKLERLKAKLAELEAEENKRR